MNVLFLAPGYDVAGLGIGMKRAFDAVAPDWHARFVRLWDNWIHYPPDIQWNREDAAQTEEVMALWRDADVVHIFEHPEAARWFPDWQRKRIIVHHLGTYYRRQPAAVSAECKAIGAVEVADMHDLITINPELGWLPDIIDIEPLVALRRSEHRPSGIVRVAHAPTDRVVKSTAVIIEVVGRLMQRYPISFDLIEGRPNAECLARKATCDIFVDELTLGYGLNACENWSMGIPNVSGIANPATRELMLRDFGELPFVDATAETLEQHLETLIVDPMARAYWSAAGHLHVRRFHSQEAVVRRAIRLYEGAALEVAA